MSKSKLFKPTFIMSLLFDGITLYGQEKKTIFGFKGGLNKSDVDATEIFFWLI